MNKRDPLISFPIPFYVSKLAFLFFSLTFLNNGCATKGNLITLDKGTSVENPEQTINDYEKAVFLDSEDLESWNQLGHLRFKVGDLSGAEASYRKVVGTENSLKYGTQEAIAYTNLGIISQTRKEFDQAVIWHQKALKVNQFIGSKVGMAVNYGNLGAVYLVRGELDRSHYMHGTSLMINREIGRREGMAENYVSLGVIHQKRGDLSRSKEMYEQSLALALELEDRHLVRTVRKFLFELETE